VFFYQRCVDGIIVDTIAAVKKWVMVLQRYDSDRQLACPNTKMIERAPWFVLDADALAQPPFAVERLKWLSKQPAASDPPDASRS
jgi:hypothetical protein